MITETPESNDREFDVLAEAGCDVDVPLVACSALALARALESPAGEHPTKSGAVSLTASHSCLLN